MIDPVVSLVLFVAMAMWMLGNMQEARSREVLKACPQCGADKSKGDKHHADCQWRDRL